MVKSALSVALAAYCYRSAYVFGLMVHVTLQHCEGRLGWGTDAQGWCSIGAAMLSYFALLYRSVKRAVYPRGAFSVYQCLPAVQY